MNSRSVLYVSLAATFGAFLLWMSGGEKPIHIGKEAVGLSAEKRFERSDSMASIRLTDPGSPNKAEQGLAGAATSSKTSNRIVPIEPTALSRRLFGSVADLGKVYRELKAREATLSGDELLILRNVLLGCMGLSSMDEQIKLEPAIAILVSSNPQRSKAADTSRRACAEIPQSELTEKRLSGIFRELIRREHASVQAESLQAITEAGFGTKSHDRAIALLASADPAIMLRIADYFAYEIRLTGMNFEFMARGLNPENLSTGWQLAVCDLTGGCGPDSQQLIGPCVTMNRCDVASLADYLQKYDPNTYPSADQFRQLILASYQSGDWTWLNLPALRSKLPA